MDRAALIAALAGGLLAPSAEADEETSEPAGGTYGEPELSSAPAYEVPHAD